MCFLSVAMVQYAVEVLDLVKRSLPVMLVAAASAERAAQRERDPSVYSDTRHLHYATLETEHPYKQASVIHHKVGRMSISRSPVPLSAVTCSWHLRMLELPDFNLKVASSRSQSLTAPAFIACGTTYCNSRSCWESNVVF